MWIRKFYFYNSGHVTTVVRQQTSTMIDGQHNQEVLIDESQRLVRAPWAENRERGVELVAIGYVFEFGRG